MAEPVLKIRVVDAQQRPIEGATVRVGDHSLRTDARGQAELAAGVGQELVVGARGFEAETRLLEAADTRRTQWFVLGRAGMAYYFRGKTRVPFERLPGTIAVLTRAARDRLSRPAGSAEESGQESAKDGGKDGADDTSDAVATALAARLGARVVRRGKGLARSGLIVLQIEGQGEDGVAKQLRELVADPAVAAAGALVRLSDKHASFVTDRVIARFDEGLGDDAVADLARRHGLEPESRFGDLGNVHRLRFDGPPTYAVLDAANALAAEPGVVYAEPDLASTSEDDAIMPADFLFRQQWDHPLIGTPDAWQSLRDMDPARTFGHADVVIAVVDSGIDATHPELSGTVAGGLAKQVALFDFDNMVANMNILAGDHGTACASAAAANIGNASPVAGITEGMAGVAGNCRLIGIRRPPQTAAESRYAELYLWAAGFNAGSSDPAFPAQLARGADVITNSFGFSINNPISGLMSDTFDRLTDAGRGGRGVLLFFSAGNDNVDLDTTFRRPWSMYDRCFGVAASTVGNDGVTEIKASYSNFGSTVDWCAPSNDNEGVHNPPQVFGALAATIQAAPGGDAVPGHPALQTTLAAAAAVGATTLTLASVAGFAVGQAVLVGAPGAVEASGRRVNAVNVATNRITLDSGLGDALPAGSPVVSGPRNYQTGFGGTSYATPVSAGTAALMVSANPQLRWQEVRDLIRSTALKIDANNTNATGRWRDVDGRISTDAGYRGPSFSEFFGFGRLNTAAAVQAAGWRISLATPALNFNDVPEGETTLRAVRFDVQSLWPVDFQIVAGPGVPFSTPLGASVHSPGTASADTVREAIVWVSYTGSTAGATAAGSVTVRHVQTGREWTLAITANTVPRQTACVMLCLDRSGSMLGNAGIGTAKRIDVLRFSAQIMVDVVHEGDGVGIVSFDHDAQDVQVPPLGPLGPVTVFDPQRDQLRSAITAFAPNPAGLTAIGDGVERAQQRLAPVTGYDSKSVVVFTDGYETDPKYISDVAASITDRVFAVALGRAENIQPAALTALTNGTGGFCVLTGELDINSRYKLAKYFLQVLAGVKNEEVVRDPDGLLAPGQVHEVDFRLTEADIAADVILMTPARGLIDMTLVTPAGDVITPADAMALPGGLYHDGQNVSYFRLTLPVPVGSGAREGRWLARLKLGRKGLGKRGFVAVDGSTAAAMAVAQHGLPYSLLVHSRSNLRMVTTLAQNGFAPGAALLLRAVLTEYGVPVAGRARVEVLVTDPQGQPRTLALAETLPGQFEVAVPTALAGTYTCRVMARGRTLRQREFSREAVRTGAVWIGGDRPPPSSGGSGGDQRPSDALCKLLHCLLSERVIQPELRKRLRAGGLDVDALLKCIGACDEGCGGKQPQRTALEQRLLEAVQSALATDAAG